MGGFYFAGTAVVVLSDGRADVNFAGLVIENVHAAGFFLGDAVLGHYFFDGEVGLEIGFDEGPEGGGEGAGHG